MPKVKAAVLERSRRSTAGKRMQSLVGKAQEDDDTFWSHSIWSETGGGFSDGAGRKRRRSSDGGGSSSSSSGEEGGSGDEGSSESDGEGSYRMSEDDSSAAVDQFDSDFDESESDEEEDEEGEEERELRAEERREKANKRKKKMGMQPLKQASAGRELMKKKTGGGKVGKRGPLGTGWNEGLVLNWPPPPSLSSGTAAATATSVGAKKPPAVTAQPIHHAQTKSATGQSIESSTSIPDATSQTLPQHAATKPALSIDAKAPAKSSLKSGTIPTPVATTTAAAAAAAPLPKAKPPSPKRSRQRQQKSSSQSTKKSTKVRHQITQEQMIIECIQSTETENSKWLNARKRMKEEAIKIEKAHAAAKNKAKEQNPISRFYSRRGCHNTLTFMDMDHLPDILTRRHHHTTAATVAKPAVTSRRSGQSPMKKRRRMDSTTSDTSESQGTTTATTTAAAEQTNQHEKCVITGKIARYRDPKTMLGYHDIDAYKEIKRRLEAGELKVAVRRDNKKRGGDSGKDSNNVTIHKSHFPFGSDKPTMLASLAGATTKKKMNVKVMVTQGGCPVSPPAVKRPSKEKEDSSSSSKANNISVGGDRKDPPELLLSAQTNLNGKKLAGGSDSDKMKTDVPKTATSSIQQQPGMKMEPMPTPSGDASTAGLTKDGNTTSSNVAAAPPEALSNELQTAFFKEKSAEAAPAPVKKRGRGRPPKQKPAATSVNLTQQPQPGAVATDGIPSASAMAQHSQMGAAKPEAAPKPKRKRGRPPKVKTEGATVPQQPQLAVGLPAGSTMPVQSQMVAGVPAVPTNPMQQSGLPAGTTIPLQQSQMVPGIQPVQPTPQQSQTAAAKPEAAPKPKRKRGRPPKAKAGAPASLPVSQQPQLAVGLPAGLAMPQQPQTTAGVPAAAPVKRKRGRPPKVKPVAPAVSQQPQMPAGIPAALANPMQQVQLPAGLPAALANPMQQAQLPAGLPVALVNQIQQAQLAAGMPAALAALMNPLQQSQMAGGIPYALANPVQQAQMAAMTDLLMRPAVPVNPAVQPQIPAPNGNNQIGNGSKVGVQTTVAVTRASSKAAAVQQPLGATGKSEPVDNNNDISKGASAVTKTSPKSIHQMKDEQP